MIKSIYIILRSANINLPINVVSFPTRSGTKMTSLTLFSTAEMSDDCVSKFTSRVHSRDSFSDFRLFSVENTGSDQTTNTQKLIYFFLKKYFSGPSMGFK